MPDLRVQPTIPDNLGVQDEPLYDLGHSVSVDLEAESKHEGN